MWDSVEGRRRLTCWKKWYLERREREGVGGGLGINPYQVYLFEPSYLHCVLNVIPKKVRIELEKILSDFL